MVRAAHSPSSLRRSVASSLSRPGFTLTELLVVIALIVLIIAIAVPAFRAITGSRSVDAGENLVSAMLSRARAEAMLNNRLAGVAFFHDTDTDRTAMALVGLSSQRAGTSSEPGGLEQYKGWSQFEENGTTATEYEVGDVVVCLVGMPPPEAPKRGTKLFVCIEAHTSAAGTRPPDGTATSRYWGTVNDAGIDSLVGYEYQLLPPGIGAQTINDPDPTGSGTAARDRYLRNGLVLFDGEGALLHRKYIIEVPKAGDTDPTHLFRLFGYDPSDATLGTVRTTPIGGATAFPIYSQLGVVLYDIELFKNAGGDDADPLINDQAPTGTENTEEQWLDLNALSLMINRYNGTLIRGE